MLRARKTICDLDRVSVDFGWVNATKRKPGNKFLIRFRPGGGKQTAQIDVDQAEAEQFIADISAATGSIGTWLLTNKTGGLA